MIGDRLRRSAHPALVPQVAAVFFVFTIAMMLLLPFIRLSFNGAEQGQPLIFLFRTDFGLNIFAILLVLAPIVGLIVSLAAPRRWAIEVFVIAAIGLICVPASIFVLSRAMGGTPNIGAHVLPAAGMYVLLVTLAVVLIDAGLEIWHERR